MNQISLVSVIFASQYPKNLLFGDAVASLSVLQLWQASRRPTRALRGTATPSNALDLDALREAYRYFRFAVAAYGWRGVVSLLLRDGLACPSFARLAFAALGGDAASFCAQAGVSHADLLFESLEPAIGAPKCYVAVDTPARALVLAFRGTASIDDTLTDFAAANVEFCGGVAHEGIAFSARALYDTVAGALSAELRARGPEWGLVVTGHSLGGATAILFTMLLMHERARLAPPPDAAATPPTPFAGVSVRCLAFGPPPVFAPLSAVPPEAAAAITSWVHGDDIVSRLSSASMQDILRLCRALGGPPGGPRTTRHERLFAPAVRGVWEWRPAPSHPRPAPSPSPPIARRCS